MLWSCGFDHFLQGCNKVVYLAGARSTATSDLYRVEQQGVQNFTQALLVRAGGGPSPVCASPLLLLHAAAYSVRLAASCLELVRQHSAVVGSRLTACTTPRTLGCDCARTCRAHSRAHSLWSLSDATIPAEVCKRGSSRRGSVRPPLGVATSSR